MPCLFRVESSSIGWPNVRLGLRPELTLAFLSIFGAGTEVVLALVIVFLGGESGDLD